MTELRKCATPGCQETTPKNDMDWDWAALLFMSVPGEGRQLVFCPKHIGHAKAAIRALSEPDDAEQDQNARP
jgi:hypothetical protein